MIDVHLRCATCGVQTTVRCTSCNTMLCPDHLARHLHGGTCLPPDIRMVNGLAAFLLHALGEAAPQYERTEWPQAANGTKQRWRHIARRTFELFASIFNALADPAITHALDIAAKTTQKRSPEQAAAYDAAKVRIEQSLTTPLAKAIQHNATLEQIASAAVQMVDDFRARPGISPENMARLIAGVDKLREIEDEYGD